MSKTTADARVTKVMADLTKRLGSKGTVKPNALAADLTRAGIAATGKTVRGWVRDHVARFDKAEHPAYQSHEYGLAEVRTIVAGLAARSGRAQAQVGSGKASKAASKPRTAPTKGTRAVRKAAAVAESVADAPDA